jgi:serine protease
MGLSARAFLVGLSMAHLLAVQITTTAAARAVDASAPITVGSAVAGVARTDRVVVTWSASDTAAFARASGQVSALARGAGRGVAFVRQMAHGRSIYRLDGPLGPRAAEVLAALAATHGVAAVEPDTWIEPTDLPNDTQAGLLWGLLGAADGSAYGIDVLGAWPVTRGEGIVVAVLDTGYVSHPDLNANVVAGWDMISDPSVSNDGNGRDSNPSDPGDFGCGHGSSWHGTHVAGTIAAVEGNALGVFGGAPGVKVQPVRVLGKCGGHETDISDAIIWASGGSVAGAGANLTPARVLNLSLSGPGACTSYMQDAIDEARARNSVVVVASGNEATNAASKHPANCQGTLAVAAITEAGIRASFSNYGSTIDLSGPGVGVVSTINTGATHPVGPTYASYSGTSMATPHVAAAAALVAAAYPSLSPDAIASLLEITSTPFAADASPNGCPSRGCGSGIVNAAAAVTALDAPTPLVGALSVDPDGITNAGSTAVAATAVDVDGIASAAYRVDSGAWLPMSAVDQVFGETSEAIAATAPIPGTGGEHSVCVRATDLDGHVSAATCETVNVLDAIPTVTEFAATTASPSAATSIAYRLRFSESVSGLSAGDFTIGGTSAGWSVGQVSGSGSLYTVTLARGTLTSGGVVLSLRAGAISDESNNGPPAPSAAPEITVLPFTDIAGSAFKDDIVWVFDEGLTVGCGSDRYCPNGVLTRGQMASYIARALDLPATSNDYFSDDESSDHEVDINRIAAAGITVGCGSWHYCPLDPVSRAQMASFLVRAFGLTLGAGNDSYVDDDASTHELDIDRVAFAEITSGCGPTTYCPEDVVTRGQMAAFLHRALTP